VVFDGLFLGALASRIGDLTGVKLDKSDATLTSMISDMATSVPAGSGDVVFSYLFISEPDTVLNWFSKASETAVLAAYNQWAATNDGGFMENDGWISCLYDEAWCPTVLNSAVAQITVPPSLPSNMTPVRWPSSIFEWASHYGASSALNFNHTSLEFSATASTITMTVAATSSAGQPSTFTYPISGTLAPTWQSAVEQALASDGFLTPSSNSPFVQGDVNNGGRFATISGLSYPLGMDDFGDFEAICYDGGINVGTVKVKEGYYGTYRVAGAQTNTTVYQGQLSDLVPSTLSGLQQLSCSDGNISG